MKVLLVHNRYQTNNIGGEDIVYQAELDMLRAKIGWDSVFSYEVSNDQAKTSQIIRSLFWSFRHQRAIEELVKEHRIDLVHVHNYFPLLSPSVFYGAKRGGAKVVQTLHSFREWCISGILYRNGFGPCEKCVGKHFPLSGIRYRCYRGSALQSLVAQISFSWYRFIGAMRAVDAAFVLTPSQLSRVRTYGVGQRQLFLKANSVVATGLDVETKDGFVYVGRLEAEKGVFLLLRAWKKCGVTGVLRLVGTGPREQELRREFEDDRTVFLGKRNRSETLGEIAKSRFLVQPSLMYETFGLTILEAYSVGTPVIGFRIGTRLDLIEHGATGFLCEPDMLGLTLFNASQYGEHRRLSQTALAFAARYLEGDLGDLQIEYYRKVIDQEY